MKKRIVLLVLFLLCLSFYGFKRIEKFSGKPEDLLTLVQKTAFNFLWQEANPEIGLVRDRTNNFSKNDAKIASIASVGFALAALPIGVENKWISSEDARLRALATLRYFADEATHQNGFYYHFVGMNSGKRVSRSELSSIDTALFLAGAIVAREYFQDSSITRYVSKIYERIDFQWMMNGGSTLTMGWTPEGGFLKPRWNDFNEGIMLTLLAMGAPQKAVPPETWDHVKRKIGVYHGIAVIQCPPLFTHQYPHLFFDLRDKHDDYADYFQNSINATRANQLYCQIESKKYKTYEKKYWGLTASDGPYGYKAYGAEPGGAVSDGTVAPTGAITSIMFTPEISKEFLNRLYTEQRDWLWGRYGFVDSFNLDLGWRAEDVIGIDQGAIALGIENYKTGLIWKLFMKAPEVQRALTLAKFRPGKREMKVPEPPSYTVQKKTIGWKWKTAQQIPLSDLRYLEVGEEPAKQHLKLQTGFAWDERYLYFRFEVEDDLYVSKRVQDNIWRDDCFELFIDPDGSGFQWGNAKKYQIGFSPKNDLTELRAWSWCQKEEPLKRKRLDAVIRKSANGFVIFGRIPWKYLKITPQKGMSLRLTPAFHDMDQDTETKHSWYFVSRDGQIDLGKLILE